MSRCCHRGWGLSFNFSKAGFRDSQRVWRSICIANLTVQVLQTILHIDSTSCICMVRMRNGHTAHSNTLHGYQKHIRHQMNNESRLYYLAAIAYAAPWWQVVLPFGKDVDGGSHIVKCGVPLPVLSSRQRPSHGRSVGSGAL